MNKILLAALLAGVASSALAADLPSKKGPPPAPVVYAPAFSWTGFYVGANAGWAFADPSKTNLPSASGGLIGGQVGYNYQVGQFVGGVEADLDYNSANRSHGYALGTNKLSVGTMTTERVRAGVAMDRALLFVTGGYAGVDVRGSFNDTVNGLNGAQTVWRNGGVVGAGIEYAFTNNLSAKAEYLYIPLSSASYFAGTPDAERSGLGINTIRAGVNYKF